MLDIYLGRYVSPKNEQVSMVTITRVFEKTQALPKSPLQYSSRSGKAFLDLYSTSQTRKYHTLFLERETDAKYGFMFDDEWSEAQTYCANGAPFVFYIDMSGNGRIAQGCCNSWNCPRCGQLRAKREYKRIVSGVEQLAVRMPLYFLHVTCLGRELSLESAQETYLRWTSKLLDAMRHSAKRAGQEWFYVQVTERQKRLHPHSHIICSFVPSDAKERYIRKRSKSGEWVTLLTLRSEWFEKQLGFSGLGSQYAMDYVKSPAGAARYVGKYMFKDSALTEWPKNWRRVRYSNSWPKLAKHEKRGFALLRPSHWREAFSLGVPVYAQDAACVKESLLMGTPPFANMAAYSCL